jgi:hypothetical protein
MVKGLKGTSSLKCLLFYTCIIFFEREEEERNRDGG